MTHPNQSELRNVISRAIRKHEGVELSSEIEKIAHVMDYITANYTPNSEAERYASQREIEALAVARNDVDFAIRWSRPLEEVLADMDKRLAGLTKDKEKQSDE